MMRTIVVFLFSVAFSFAIHAADYSSGTKLFLHQNHPQIKHAKSTSSPHHIPCFIEAAPHVAASLRSQGVKLTQVAPHLYTAQISPSFLSSDAEARIDRIAVAKKVQICNDSALYFSHWSPSITPDLFSKFDGTGVIVGMIDTGFDVNHINFKSPDGKSRISAVYFPSDTTGMEPVVGADTLPGSAYYADQIQSLTSDCTALHGTHTMGTAAGSYVGNPYTGVATCAELVVCGMPENELTDVNIANSLKFIFHYAALAQKPCVVNMSLSSYAEAHDGSSYLCKVFEQLSGNGKIIVVSAGNDGNKDVCLHKQLSTTADTLSTFLSNQYYGYNLSGHLSMWSDSEEPFSMRAQVVDRTTGEVLYVSPWLSALPGDSVFAVSSQTDATFSQFYDGEWLFASAVEPNGKFHSDFVVDAKYKNANHAMRLQYTAANPVSLRGWGSSNMRFITYSFPNHTSGDASMSISDLCTSDSVISVGAYCARTIPAVISGVNADVVKGAKLHQIAPFSAYGADMRGVQHPDVVAPGMAVVSSYSRFNQSLAVSNNWLTTLEQVDGITYPYGINGGTSMSAPVVTGAIALALQANPHLSIADLKALLRLTSTRDSFVESDPIRWGSGKLNIEALLQRVQTFNPLDLNLDGEVNVSDVTYLVSLIINGDTNPRSDINADGATNVSDVSALIHHLLY
ncbi:MAG: S8 family serine peptidase [Sodaliphilus sp.]